MSRRGRIERECKLTADPPFVMPDLDGVVGAGIRAHAVPPLALEAVYFDTPDLRLARAGISVRFRTGEESRRGRGRWTVKLPSGDRGPISGRREIDVLAPRRTVPTDVATLVRGHVRGALLGPVATVRTERRRVALTSADGTAVAEVADDAVAVIERGAVVREFRELEVELADGAGDEILTAAIGALVGAGARVSSQRSKVVQALGERALEPPEGRPAALDPDEATLRDVVAASLAAAYTQLLRHDPGLRIDDEAEDVHQARVATRRLRSDLRTFRDVLDARADGLREELRWWGGVLGAVRDADVLRMRLARQAATALPVQDAEAAAALLRRLGREQEDARAGLRAALDSDRYLALLDRLLALAVAPPVVDAGARRARKRLAGIVERPWRHLAKAVDRLPDHPDDESLHEIRIRTKRTRYAAEAAAPVVGRRAAKFAKTAARLQTVLGDLQDAVVAETWLRTAAAGGTGSEAFVAGQLVAVQRQAMAAARSDWTGAWDELWSRKPSGRSWSR